MRETAFLKFENYTAKYNFIEFQKDRFSYSSSTFHPSDCFPPQTKYQVRDFRSMVILFSRRLPDGGSTDSIRSRRCCTGDGQMHKKGSVIQSAGSDVGINEIYENSGVAQSSKKGSVIHSAASDGGIDSMLKPITSSNLTYGPKRRHRRFPPIR